MTSYCGSLNVAQTSPYRRWIIYKRYDPSAICVRNETSSYKIACARVLLDSFSREEFQYFNFYRRFHHPVIRRNTCEPASSWRRNSQTKGTNYLDLMNDTIHLNTTRLIVSNEIWSCVNGKDPNRFLIPREKLQHFRFLPSFRSSRTNIREQCCTGEN